MNVTVYRSHPGTSNRNYVQVPPGMGRVLVPSGTRQCVVRVYGHFGTTRYRMFGMGQPLVPDKCPFYTERNLELIRPPRRRTNSILIAELRFEVVLAIQITILIWNSFYAPTFEKVGSILVSACLCVHPCVRASVRPFKKKFKLGF